MPDKIVHKIHLDRYAPMPAQIQLGTVESYGVEQIAVVAGAGWDGLDIVAVYHPPKAAEPVRVLVPSDGLSDVPPEATASAGRGALVIAGMADGVQIASCNISYTVIAQAGTDGTTSDTPTPDLVQQILSAANGAVKTADGVREDMDKVLEAESGRETAEADRAEAESERVTAETARVDAEADRAAAEKERQTAESARIAAENDRQSAETSRAKAETARVEAEAEREKQLPALKSSVDELRARQNILVGSETGNPITVDDAFAAPLCGLTVYGQSTQDGTPSTANPVPIVTAGEGGTVVVSLGNGSDKSQTITYPTPNGLPGIPVASGGNYTDPSGQRWVCDAIDFTRNVKTQRIKIVDMADCEITGNTVLGNTKRLTGKLAFKAADYRYMALCNRSQFKADFRGDYEHFYVDGGNVFLFVPISNALPKKGEYIIALTLATPLETPLTATEIAAYKALTAYGPDTVVQASDGAGIKLDYQRDVNLVVKNLEDAIASMTTT